MLARCFNQHRFHKSCSNASIGRLSSNNLHRMSFNHSTESTLRCKHSRTLSSLMERQHSCKTIEIRSQCESKEKWMWTEAPTCNERIAHVMHDHAKRLRPPRVLTNLVIREPNAEWLRTQCDTWSAWQNKCNNHTGWQCWQVKTTQMWNHATHSFHFISQRLHSWSSPKHGK